MNAAKHLPPPLKMKVSHGHLVPATAYDQERLDSFRQGSTVSVRFTADRMRPLERKYRAILGKVVKECKTPWTNAEAAHQAIKLACGIVNVSKTAGGQFFQYPRSLVDLDDKEMEEYFNDAMALLERLTGVDVETLKRETAHVDAEDDEIIDPQTGEITNPGKDTPSSDAGDDDASPSVQASSTEPEDSAKSSADTGSNEESAVSPSPNTPALAAGSSSQSQLPDQGRPDLGKEPASPSLPQHGAGSLFSLSVDDAELQHLIDFARKGLSEASADKDAPAKHVFVENMRLNYLDAVESKDGRGCIEAISKALSAVISGKRSAEQAADYIARDVLDCDVNELEMHHV